MGTGRYWVGLDISESCVDICVLGRDGQTTFEGHCLPSAKEVRTALSQFRKSSIGCVAVEAGVGTHLVRSLRSRGFPVAIYESRKSSRFLAIRRNKTDANDAKGLADLARLGSHAVSEVRLKSLSTQLLRAQLVTRDRLVKHRLAMHSTLRAILALHGGELKVPRTGRDLRKRFSEEVKRVGRMDGTDLDPHLRPLMELCDLMNNEVKRMDRALLESANSEPICKLLMTIPGVGPVCAISFFTAVEDPSRFAKANDVGAYLGLVPKVRQSGGVTRTGGISKMGNRLTRGHLVSAATALLWSSKAECELRSWGLRLIDRLGPQGARVAVARKLAVLMVAMWKSGEPFDSGARDGRRRLR